MPNFKVSEENRKYIYIPKDPGNTPDSWTKIFDENWANLTKCGEMARKAKQYIGQYFRIGVADGHAVYQIVSETATKFGVQHCTGLGDDWADHHFGYGGSFPKKDVLRYIDYENGMRDLFSKASKKKK